MSTPQNAEEAWKRIEERCRHLAPTTPVLGVLAIVRDVLIPPGEESFCRACSHPLSGPAHPECITPEQHLKSPGACGICGRPLNEVGTSRCYEAHGRFPPEQQT